MACPERPCGHLGATQQWSGWNTRGSNALQWAAFRLRPGRLTANGGITGASSRLFTPEHPQPGLAATCTAASYWYMSFYTASIWQGFRYIETPEAANFS